MLKLQELCGSSVTLKCPLPNGDLETLISITSDEDLANIIEEYDQASSSLAHRLKIRAVLSPLKSSIKKVSPPLSYCSSVTHSPSGSPHASADSLLSAAAYRFYRQNCSPVSVGYPISVRYGVVKGCCNTGQLDGSPRFLYRLSHCNNYCHWCKVDEKYQILDNSWWVDDDDDDDEKYQRSCGNWEVKNVKKRKLFFLFFISNVRSTHTI